MGRRGRIWRRRRSLAAEPSEAEPSKASAGRLPRRTEQHGQRRQKTKGKQAHDHISISSTHDTTGLEEDDDLKDDDANATESNSTDNNKSHVENIQPVANTS